MQGLGSATQKPQNKIRLFKEMLLETPRPPGSKECSKVPGALQYTSEMQCTCNNKGDHWAPWCPHKDLAVPPADTASASGTSKLGTNIYVPPGKRDGVKQHGSGMGPRRTGEIVHISAFSEEIPREKPGPPGSKECSKVPGALQYTGEMQYTCNNKGDHWAPWCPHKDLAVPPADTASASGTSFSEEIPRGKPRPHVSEHLLCRVCGQKGVHWPSMCPEKDLVGVLVTYTKPLTRDLRSYFHPRKNNKNNSIFVCNLIEHNIDERGLRQLFGDFGDISNVHVSEDSGYVSFVKKEDAERAFNNLIMYGYEHILDKENGF